MLFLTADADWDEVADLLGDKMDDEFNTICEDDSTDEVGLLLWEFYKTCCAGDKALVEQELEKLPSGNWLSKCLSQSQPIAAQVGIQMFNSITLSAANVLGVKSSTRSVRTLEQLFYFLTKICVSFRMTVTMMMYRVNLALQMD